MKIGYCVEGGADRAVIVGLKGLWCPNAELVEGTFRGQFTRSQIAKECKILIQKGADLVVFLRDANRESWREVLKADEAKCPQEFRDRVVFGVCDRNVECWLAADVAHLASHLGCKREDMASDDPAPMVKKAFGLMGFDKESKEPEVSKYVKKAPLRTWLRNKSFENFYDQLWRQAKAMQCDGMENLHERA